MFLNVGPLKYHFGISAKPIIIGGREKLGSCDEARRLILISPRCPVRNRLTVLLHEATHAWIFATGMPNDLESWCDLTALVCASVLRDLPAQGGEAALMLLEPGESPQAGAARIALSRSRYCAICESTIAPASVVCISSVLPGMLDLSLYCEHCNHIQMWLEAASASGLPSGAVVGEPKFFRGAAVAEFLRQHSQCSTAVMA